MSDFICQARATVQVPAHEPWGPMVGLDPIQEYRVLAHELQECFPDAEPRQLDCMIVCEMVLYGGYSADVVIQAMCAASLHLAGGNVGDPQAYVERTVDEAMQQALTDDTVLGWEG
jgi:RepB DNA-primase C-terminal helical domain